MVARIPPRSALFLAVLLSLAACGSKKEQPAVTGQGTFANIDQLTDAEKRYGMGARRDPNITLQPDVVLMEAGRRPSVRRGRMDSPGRLTPMPRGWTRSSRGRSSC